MPPKLIHLYSGIGGLSLGAARAGFQLAASIDNDEILSEIHEINFPSTPHFQDDISELTADELIEKAGIEKEEIFGIAGGSPCQGFSRIGKRELNDDRNKLFSKLFELTAGALPDFFLAENVEGILDEQNEQLVDSALDLVRSSYRLLEPFVLNAADFGAPTNRKRVFFFGQRGDRLNDLSLADFEDAKWWGQTHVEEALTGLPRKLRDDWSSDEKAWRKLRQKCDGDYWERIYNLIPAGVGDPETIKKFREDDLVSSCLCTHHSDDVKERFEALAEGETDPISRMPRLRRDGLCPTLRAGTGRDKGSFQALRPVHFSEPRVIMPREAARLQGFPDWFRFHETKWHTFRGIGNSVSPLIAEALFEVIYNQIRNDT
jgi:DNA (cytosine-5)-methyltransferase 1